MKNTVDKTFFTDIYKANILGVEVSALKMDQVIKVIESWIKARKPRYICLIPAHLIMNSVNDPKLRWILNFSAMNAPDGMGIVWLLKILGYKQVGRVYGPDLMEICCRESVRHGWKHYFYGGADRVPEKVASVLTKKYPRLQVAGIYSPPFRPLTPEEDEKIVQQINHSGADIVWVGIGSPKQELWMGDHLGKINAPIMIGVGAAFDFIAGTKREAPKWIQRFGFEWLYRLFSEPKRLWPRYKQYPYFLFLVLLQFVFNKKYPNI